MAKIESFDGLISSIQEAFLSVNRLAENQHLEALHEFMEEDGSPKTIRIKYPYFNEDGDVEYRFVEVPELCLVPVSTLKLSEVSVDFKVKLAAEIRLKKDDEGQQVSALSTEVDQKPLPRIPKRRNRMGFIPGFRQKQDDSYANITLKFNAEEPPEGMLRIRDEMIKILP